MENHLKSLCEEVLRLPLITGCEATTTEVAVTIKPEYIDPNVVWVGEYESKTHEVWYRLEELLLTFGFEHKNTQILANRDEVWTYELKIVE